MTYIPKFQDALVALPSVIAINALVPGGVESLDEDVYDALRRDELTDAMEAAEAWYAESGGSDAATISYALLLEGCDLLDDAFDFVETVRADRPETPALALVEAEIRLDRGENEEALEILDSFCESHEESTDVDGSVWGFAGDLLLDLGRDDVAVDCYEKALAMGTEDFETVIRLAQLHSDRGEFRRAAECFETAAELGGDVVGPWEEAAENWKRAGQIHRSLEAREKVLESRSEDAAAWARQGVGYAHVGEEEKAIEALQKATRIDESRPEYWIELAHILRGAGRSERAIESYKKVLEFEEEFLEALNGLTAAALDQGDVALAEETARQSVELDGENASAWALLGDALRAEHDASEAEDAIHRAIELEPENPDHHRRLGELLLEEGRTDEGFEELMRAVDLNAEGGAVVLPFAEALLRAQEYGRLRELLDSRADWAGSKTWQLTRPVLRVLIEGIEKSSKEVEPSVESFEEAVKASSDTIPLRYDFGELSRYAMVIDDHRQWVVDRMIDVLEGRKSLDDIRAQIDEGS